MKRIINILLIGAALILSSCGEGSKESKALDITGTWELTDIEITKAAQLGSEKIEVTIIFNSDKTFSLSQTLGSGRPKDFSGTWQLTGTILTGKYSNGKAWGSSYEVAVNGTEMTMTPEGGAEIYTYKKK